MLVSALSIPFGFVRWLFFFEIAFGETKVSRLLCSLVLAHVFMLSLIAISHCNKHTPHKTTKHQMKRKNCTVKFLVYDNVFARGRKNLSPAEGATAGAAATAFAQLVTTPLDVVRNRVMTSTSSSAATTTATDSSSPSSSSLSYTETLAVLAQEEGLAGFFAGATPRVAKAVLSGAIQFATYEETKTQIANLFVSSSPSPPSGAAATPTTMR